MNSPVPQGDRSVVAGPVLDDPYRILLLGNHAADLLVAGERPRFALPCVPVPRWERPAENLCAAVRKCHELSAICLFTLEPPAGHRNGERVLYQVMETRNARVAPPGKMHWVPLNSIGVPSFLDEQDLVAVTDM